MLEGNVGEIIKFSNKNGNLILIAKLHFYDGAFKSMGIEVRKEEEKIIIKGSKEILENIKTLLLRRDSFGDVVWSIFQNEYRTLDKLEEKVSKLQNEAIHTSSKNLLSDILSVKKSLTRMHRDYLRIRNIVETIIDEEKESMMAHRILRDINEMIDVVEYLVEGTTTAIQLMQNALSVKMNEVMKILTIIATIMMPLTLITGIYGMNFRNMPELYWEYGYYYSLLLMLAVGLVMMYYFKKRELI